MLWAFDDVSFVPHVLATDALAADTPVLLTAADLGGPCPTRPGAPTAWLLNLDDDCPPNYDGLRAPCSKIVSADGDDHARRRASAGASTRPPGESTCTATTWPRREANLSHPYPADGIPTLTQRAEDDIPVLDTPVAASPARPAAQPTTRHPRGRAARRRAGRAGTGRERRRGRGLRPAARAPGGRAARHHGPRPVAGAARLRPSP